jgi:hypothetical protein
MGPGLQAAQNRPRKPGDRTDSCGMSWVLLNGLRNRIGFRGTALQLPLVLAARAELTWTYCEVLRWPSLPKERRRQYLELPST